MVSRLIIIKTKNVTKLAVDEQRQRVVYLEDLRKMKVLVAQWCLTLCNPMD